MHAGSGCRLSGVDTAKHLIEWGRDHLLIVTRDEEAAGGSRPLRAQLDAQFAKDKANSPDMNRRTVNRELVQESIHGTRRFDVVEGIEASLATWFS